MKFKFSIQCLKPRFVNVPERYRNYRYIAWMGALYILGTAIAELVTHKDILSVAMLIIWCWVLYDVGKYSILDYRESKALKRSHENLMTHRRDCPICNEAYGDKS